MLFRLTALVLFSTLLVAGCSDSDSSSDDNGDSGTPTDQDGNGDGSDDGDGSGDGDGNGDGSGDGGTSSDSTAISGNVSQFGVISIDDDADSMSTSAGAFFFGFPQEISAQNIAGSIGALLEQDFCSVSAFDPDDDNPLPDFEDTDLPDNFAESIVTLSAGQAITLARADGTTYGELTFESLFGFDTYLSVDDLTYPAPSPVVINIPGDEFPAFSNVSVAAADPLDDLTASTGETITADTTASWTPNSGGGARIDFSATTSDFTVSLDCNLVDDGSFSLPADAVAELNSELGAGWTLELDEASRNVIVIQQSGNAVLMAQRSNDD